MGACLAAVRSSNADPGVPDLLIVDLRIIDHDIQTQSLHRQSADRRQQRLRSNDAIVLRSHGKLSQNGDVGRPKFLRYRLVILRIGSREPEVGIKRAFTDFHRELGNVDAVHGGEYRGALRLAFGNRSWQRRRRQADRPVCQDRGGRD